MIKAKKSLGQNFLTDRNILNKIVNVTKIENKTILEVGPGTGNLTSFILKNNPKKVFVIEKDNDLAEKLNLKFGEQLTIINDDILSINENLLFDEKVTVFGNLPYNISTEILSKWILNLKDNFWFDHLVLMFQKEVAERIIATFNKSSYGRLSILANWKLDVKKIFDIKPESFSPRPKIDSSLLFFSPKQDFQKIKDPKNLEKITKIFFNQRRKMIKKPISILFKKSQFDYKKFNINPTDRPQNIDVNKYLKIVNEFETLGG